MRKGFQVIEKIFTLIFYGISTFTIYPNVDYNQYISTNDDMMRRSWERTGRALKNSINALEAKYEKEQTANSQRNRPSVSKNI